MTVLATQAIILAAGKSTRFNTGNTKLLEKLCGQEMVLFSTSLLAKMQIPTTVIVGYQKEQVQQAIQQRHGDAINFVVQEEQRGTGHALICTRNHWNQENILVINGDMPLITQEIIATLYAKHHQTNAAISFVVAHNADPSLGAYGRVVISNGVTEIVEARHFTGDPAEHCFINAGIYLIKRSFLQQHVDAIPKNEASKEFYITDLVKIASQTGYPVTTTIASFDQVRGINTFQELWAAEQIKKSELVQHWMERGVRFFNTGNIHLDVDIEIGAGTFIGCGAHLLRGTKIGKNCKINEYVSIYNTSIGDNVTIYSHVIIEESVIADGACVGPFAHMRDKAILGKNAQIGNFVEVKNSTIGENSKAKHLSYLGDAQIGANVNIGAGTITCNYDGVSKHKTIIQDNTFIGSNNTLVAPVTIGSDVITAAGSTITENVPSQALAIARTRQINKLSYAVKLRAKQKAQAEMNAQGKHTEHFAGAMKTAHDGNLHENS